MHLSIAGLIFRRGQRWRLEPVGSDAWLELAPEDGGAWLVTVHAWDDAGNQFDSRHRVVDPAPFADRQGEALIAIAPAPGSSAGTDHASLALVAFDSAGRRVFDFTHDGPRQFIPTELLAVAPAVK